jgi:hypothetical protein
LVVHIGEELVGITNKIQTLYQYIYTVNPTVCDLEDIYLSPMIAPKRAASSKSSQDKTKCQRKMLTILKKVRLLDMIKGGKKIVEVSEGKHSIGFDSHPGEGEAALSASFSGRTSSRILFYDVRGFHGEQGLVREVSEEVSTQECCTSRRSCLC